MNNAAEAEHFLLSARRCRTWEPAGRSVVSAVKFARQSCAVIPVDCIASVQLTSERRIVSMLVRL
jgi:hypothetical protein